MAIDDKIKRQKYNMTLTEKHQKYQHYHQIKVINTNILEVNRFFFLIKDK